MLVLKGHFFGALIYSPMENEEDQQQMLDLITKTAEQLEIEVQDMAPFIEKGFVGKMSEKTQGLSVEDDDLISIAVEVIGEMALADDEETTEPETETPVVEAEAEDVETTTEDETTDDEAIAAAILSFLAEDETGSTNAGLRKMTGFSKEQVDSVVKQMIDGGLVHKVKKTVFFGPKPEENEDNDEGTWVDSTDGPVYVEPETGIEIPVEVEDVEPMAEKTNTPFLHALNVQFDGIRDLFATELDKVQSTADADSGYKSQAEQYTEVMTQLRDHLDSIQREQGWLLAAPVWQVVARIAEWHPEA